MSKKKRHRPRASGPKALGLLCEAASAWACDALSKSRAVGVRIGAGDADQGAAVELCRAVQSRLRRVSKFSKIKMYFRYIFRVVRWRNIKRLDGFRRSA